VHDFHRGRDEETKKSPLGFLSSSIHETYTVQDGTWQAKENTTVLTVWLLLSRETRDFVRIVRESHVGSGPATAPVSICPKPDAFDSQESYRSQDGPRLDERLCRARELCP
jgi:hypothetical protein